MLVLSEPLRVVRQWVCGRSLAAIVGSNTVGGMDICLLWVLCVVRERSLRRADPSSRVVLERERKCVCVIEFYQMQQSTSTSTRVDRGGQTKKGRKMKASLVRSIKLEQTMMLLTCIRTVDVWNQNCNTDCANRPSSQRFWVPRGKCVENSWNKADVLKNIECLRYWN
jgi:hypothetical protein